MLDDRASRDRKECKSKLVQTALESKWQGNSTYAVALESHGRQSIPFGSDKSPTKPPPPLLSPRHSHHNHHHGPSQPLFSENNHQCPTRSYDSIDDDPSDFLAQHDSVSSPQMPSPLQFLGRRSHRHGSLDMSQHANLLAGGPPNTYGAAPISHHRAPPIIVAHCRRIYTSLFQVHPVRPKPLESYGPLRAVITCRMSFWES
jgi:hypothetical protein